MMPANTTREQAAGWKDTVLNPVLAQLRGQQRLLHQGNWSWRQHDEDLEYVKPLRYLTGHYYWPNAEQLFEADETFATFARTYEAALDGLREACTKAHSVIVDSTAFAELVEDLVSEEDPAPASRFDIPRYLAEHMVNGVAELPHHYTTSTIWNPSRADFVDLAQQDGEIARSLQELAVAGSELRKRNEALHDYCEQLRNELAREFRLPRITPKRFAAEPSP